MKRDAALIRAGSVSARSLVAFADASGSDSDTHRRRGNKRAGYTLIEVLVALTVLIAGFTALSTMTTRARRAAIAAEELSIAQLTCQTRVNELLAGVRPVSPAFDEPLGELENWYMTTELFPATKSGLTALRVQVQRRLQPGESSGGFGSAHSFEITSWVGNARLDPQIVQAMQRNPYAMMHGGGMQQGGMFGGSNMGMSGGMTLADSMAASGMGMPSMPGNMQSGMMSNSMTGTMGSAMGGGLPPFDTTPSSADIPPLPLGGDFGDISGNASGGNMAGAMMPDASTPDMGMFDTSAAPPPLEIPLDPLAVSGTTTRTRSPTTTASVDVPGDINVETADTLPDPEGDSDAENSEADTTGDATPASEETPNTGGRRSRP